MLIVQKYGGATLETPEKIKNAARRIAQLKNQNTQIVAVVSAMGQTTNQLINLAHQVSNAPQLREFDMLLSVGERISMSLVSMALHDLSCEAISFTGSQAGIFTSNSHLNAMIIDVKADRVQKALNENKIVILAGFQGVSPETKEITTLGRGGSDTSAVAMAAYLKADRCEILKDVPSVFTADPKLVPHAKPLKNLNYSHLLEMTFWGAKVLHYRSVELAQQKNVVLYVGPAHDDHHFSELSNLGTLITGDFMFETARALAVNSHQHVLELKVTQPNLAAALDILMTETKLNNIGTPQVLMSQTQQNLTVLFVTGPSEMMTALSKFKSDQIQTTNNNLCSVSLTCTGSTLNDLALKASKLLNDSHITVYQFLQSAMSLNFFIEAYQKEKAVQLLHSLIP